MDKNTFSQYGWIVILVVILAILIPTSTVFGSKISFGIRDNTTDFKNGVFDRIDKLTQKDPIKLKIEGEELIVIINPTSGKDITYVEIDINGTTEIIVIENEKTRYDLSELENGNHIIKVTGYDKSDNKIGEAKITYNNEPGVSSTLVLQSPILSIEEETYEYVLLGVKDPAEQAERAEIFVDGEYHGDLWFSFGEYDVHYYEIPSELLSATNMEIRVVVHADGYQPNSAALTYTPGSLGELPTLAAPTIYIEDRGTDIYLNIEDDTHCAEWADIYIDGVRVASVEMYAEDEYTMYNITADIENKENVVISVTIGATGYNSNSATIVYPQQLPAPVLSMSGEVLTIRDPSANHYMETAKVYVDGSLVDLGYFASGELQCDLWEVLDFFEEVVITVDVEAFGFKPNSATIIYWVTPGSCEAPDHGLETLPCPTLSIANDTLIITDTSDGKIMETASVAYGYAGDEYASLDTGLAFSNGVCEYDVTLENGTYYFYVIVYADGYNPNSVNWVYQIYGGNGETVGGDGCMHTDIKYSSMGEGVHEMDCEDCSIFLGSESHTYRNGFCMYCGYENTCEDLTDPSEYSHIGSAAYDETQYKSVGEWLNSLKYIYDTAENDTYYDITYSEGGAPIVNIYEKQ